MIGFFIKKSFFDGWDNLLSLLLVNLGHIALLLAALAVWGYVQSLPLALLLMAVLILLWSFYCGGASAAAKRFAAYGKGDWRSFGQGIGRHLGHCLLSFGVAAAALVCLVLGIPFYLQTLGGLAGVALAAFMFWLVVFVGLAMQYFFPLAQTFEKDRPLKTFKKCFYVLAGNFGFSVFLAFHTIANLALSLVLALMLPGLAGVQLSQAVALRLILLKYDWLEDHPDLSPKERRRPPWDEILVEEREAVGHRTLKGMIFPWKE